MTNSRSSENSKKGKCKGIHTETHYNNYQKTKRIFIAAREKRTMIYKASSVITCLPENKT